MPQAFWVTGPGRGQIRPVPLPEPGPDEVLVRTRYSAFSRGTESLVFAGRVPPSQYGAMRAPFQEGDFPGPVKYGYLNVGVAETGALRGRTVFCLYPHQDRYVVPAAAVRPVPDGVPAERAVLAGTVETAVNALWDAAPLVGDRIAVIGAGMVGCCVARIAARLPGARVTLVDVEPDRARIAARLGAEFATPGQTCGRYDVVIHASATAAGLEAALELLPPDGAVIELSWYGDDPVALRLGGAFHSRRLAIRASQVGAVAPARRATRTTADRLDLALQLLRDPAFDALIEDRCAFTDLPARVPGWVATPGLCHLIDYRS
ncbi:MAG TPA: zinc-binding alcohol dehydrogenase [Mycobacteriales bacterium]|nr:zinc-binding alcohol dehydrogenase [Mycobacteriales bacterium]